MSAESEARDGEQNAGVTLVQTPTRNLTCYGSDRTYAAHRPHCHTRAHLFPAATTAASYLAVIITSLVVG